MRPSCPSMYAATVSTGTDSRRSTRDRGERAWARQEPTWGIWRVPDAELHVLREDRAGKDVIERGCGTAYIAAWLARRGARVVGIDVHSALLTLCVPEEDGRAASDRLLRPAFGMS